MRRHHQLARVRHPQPLANMPEPALHRQRRRRQHHRRNNSQTAARAAAPKHQSASPADTYAVTPPLQRPTRPPLQPEDRVPRLRLHQKLQMLANVRHALPQPGRLLHPAHLLQSRSPAGAAHSAARDRYRPKLSRNSSRCGKRLRPSLLLRQRAKEHPRPLPHRLRRAQRCWSQSRLSPAASSPYRAPVPQTEHCSGRRPK